MKTTRCTFRLLLALVLAALVLPAAAEPPAEGDARTKRVIVKVKTSDDGSGEPHVFHFQGDPRVQVIDLEEGGFGQMLERGYLGVELTTLTPELRSHFGAPAEAGLLVARVEPDSPAARAGVRVGDVLTAVNGETIDSIHDLQHRIGGLKTGDLAAIEVIRDGRLETVNATIEVRERPQIDVRRFIHRAGEEGAPFVWQFEGGEDMPEIMEGVRQRLQVLRGHEGDLLKRLQEMEQKLEAMQQELDRLKQ